MAGGVSVLLLGALGLVLAFDRAASAREVETQEASAPARGRLLEALPLDPTFGRVFVQEWGPANAMPILVVHGVGAWGGFWANTAEALGKAGLRIVAVDLPPFGFSDRDAQARYSRADQAARLVGVLDALDVCRGVIVGHSFGAGAVVEALMRSGHRFEAAVLISAAVAPPAADAAPEAPEAPGLATRALLASDTATRMFTASTLSNPWLTRYFVASMLARKSAATPEFVQVLRQPLQRAGTTAAYASWLPFLLLPEPEALSMREDAYRNLRNPIALIWGDADTVTPLAQARRLAQLIPKATLDVLPGVGHIPQIEDPAQTVKLLATLLPRLAPSVTDPTTPRRFDSERCDLKGI
jgi:pimeloyl-ACP methyl ester carboxylesterase